MELISTMEIREQIIHPLYVVGFGIGADASLLAALEENRIKGFKWLIQAHKPLISQ